MVSLAATALSLLLGVPLAWLLARATFPGRSVLRAIVVLPVVLPPVVGGIGLLNALGRGGVVGRWLYEGLGIQLTFTIWGAIVAATFVSMPLVVLATEAGLRSLDQRYERRGRHARAPRPRVRDAPGRAADAAARSSWPAPCWRGRGRSASSAPRSRSPATSQAGPRRCRSRCTRRDRPTRAARSSCRCSWSCSRSGAGRDARSPHAGALTLGLRGRPRRHAAAAFEVRRRRSRRPTARPSRCSDPTAPASPPSSTRSRASSKPPKAPRSSSTANGSTGSRPSDAGSACASRTTCCSRTCRPGERGVPAAGARHGQGGPLAARAGELLERLAPGVRPAAKPRDALGRRAAARRAGARPRHRTSPAAAGRTARRRRRRRARADPVRCCARSPTRSTASSCSSRTTRSTR